MADTYRARYRLLIGEDYREPGELVPEAHTWYRVESYLHTGRIIEAQVEESELREAIAKYCPDLEREVIERAGLEPGYILEGPHKRVRKMQATPKGRKRSTGGAASERGTPVPIEGA